MAVNELLSIIGILGILFLIAHGRASYWKGKFEAVDIETYNNISNLQKEVLFLRRIVNNDAAEASSIDFEEHY